MNDFAVHENDVAALCREITIIESYRKRTRYNADNFHVGVPVERHFVFRVVLIYYIDAERKILRSVLFKFVKAHNGSSFC